jgi:uncharacterized membrane protein
MCDIAIIVILMIVGGVVGGSANWVIRDAPADTAENMASTEILRPNPIRLGWLGYCILGIAASASVPLFLSLAQSELLKSVTLENEKETLTFVGMCIVAAFSSKNFMMSISEKLIAEVQAAKRQVNENKESISEVKENISPKLDGSASINSGEESIAYAGPRLSELEVRVLRAASYLSKRTASGIAKDASLTLDEAKPIFDELLDNKKMMDRTTSNQSGSIRYSINKNGIAALQHHQSLNM